jgi:hypothetical protein
MTWVTWASSVSLLADHGCRAQPAIFCEKLRNCDFSISTQTASNSSIKTDVLEIASLSRLDEVLVERWWVLRVELLG